MPSRPHPARRLARLIRPVLIPLASAALLWGSAPPAIAADEPQVPGLTLEARALMAGHVRPGAWAAISVQVTNDGPPLTGELRVRGPQDGRSVYGQPVELPGTSRQQYTLYAQPPLFGTRVFVDLISGGRTILTTEVPVKSHDAYAPIIAVLAERPEGLLAGVSDASRQMAVPGFETRPATVIPITTSDLPPRVQAWSAIDRLVWQDVDARQLSSDQLEALRLWISAGGRLVVVGGTTGVGTLGGLPADLLPFVPTATVDVAAADLRTLLGTTPAGVTSTPAIAGTLRDGSVWGRAGDRVFAAQSTLGQGTVTLAGINPAEAWLVGSDAGRGLWRRLLPAADGAQVNVLNLADDSVLVGVLNSLPSIDLPPIEQLFLLLFAYVALIGPVNYLILRRLDRREWAWVTMPALVAIFAVGSYGMGASLKGSDVILNEVAIVRAGEGSERGLGQVYVGVFSPSRRSFDIRIADRALVTNPATELQTGQPGQPLDVLIGETARLRNFEVGFGLLRAFRAETATAVPLIESELHLSRGRVNGSVTNRSDTTLENAAVAYAGGVAALGTLAPGQTAEVTIDTATAFDGSQLSERVFGTTFPRDEAQARVVYTRRTVIDQISGYSAGIAGSNAVPMLVAWRPGAVLDIELAGERPNRVGDSLYLMPLSMTLDRETLLHDQSLVKTVVDAGGQGFADGSSYSLGRGAMVIEVRPATFGGRLAVRTLELALTHGDLFWMRGAGTPTAPLPDAEQPDQADPLGQPDDPAGPRPFDAMPRLQLYDHGAGLWFEFPEFIAGRSYLIQQPERYVDGDGRVLVRVVNRHRDEHNYFALRARLEGITE